ncbi:hypothetical protein SDC9_104174 [bioreactor metagenome]|uniref:Uncharacterized protein n=1 Tax=bioreactor metagenome TaxID=1076179 RepID=A0A645AVT0_9ZZZZ
MYVYIDFGRIGFKENKKRRDVSLLYEPLVSFEYGFLEIGAPEIAVVCKKVLVARGFAGILGFAYEASDFDNGGFHGNFYQFFADFPAGYLQYPFLEGSRVKMVHNVVVVGKAEREVRTGYGYPGEFLVNLAELGSITFEELPACRNIIK